MPVLRLLLNGSVATLLMAAAALTATAQDSSLGPFPEGHVSASSRKLAPDAGPRQKYAIVIGNQSYSHAPQLPNAWNDALDVADLLAGQGYDVTLLKDASKRDFEGLMQRVLFDVDRETEVLFYYAGHGVQIGSENYLIPTDAQLDQVDDLPFETVSVGSLVSILGARARLQIVILDSCRNNPFAGVKLQDSLGPDVRVNCISPGLVKTDFAKALHENPVLRAKVEGETPLRRIGEPDDIGGIAVLLASAAGQYITGQTIVADGGMMIR